MDGSLNVSTTASIILAVGVLPAWIFSFLLIVKKRADLIAGYDEHSIANPRRYALWVGWSLFLCGAGLLAIGLLHDAGRLSGLQLRYLTASVVALTAVLAFLANAGCARR